ncbi:hypothetical protein BDV18DRAFT_162582 [Aspergillus unguis]
MAKEDFKDKLRSLGHGSRKGSSESDSILSLLNKLRETSEVAQSPYNGDQCFGSCCRGKGYSR